MVHFDATTGLYADDIDTVRTYVKEAFLSAFAAKGILNTDSETPAGQLIDSLTALVVAKDSEVLYLANQFNPQTASGVWQEALARIYFLDKNFATSTVVTCVCYGLSGTVIPAGSLVQDSNGNQYANAEAVEIEDDGSVTADFTCTVTGPIDCAAGQITQIVTVTPGWDSVENLVAGVPGSDEEGQGSFEKRRYDSVAGNAHGSAYSVQCALKKLSSVKDAMVLDNRKDEEQTISGVTLGRHSDGICVYGGTSTEIGQVIYERLDAGVGTGGEPEVTSSYTPVPADLRPVDTEIPYDYIYNEVENPSEDDNPQEKGWYELVDGEYVLSEDVVVDVDKTYYTQSTEVEKKWYRKTVGVDNYYNNYAETKVLDKNVVYFTKAEVEVQKIKYEAEDGIEHEYTIIRPVPTPVYLYVTIQYTSKTKATVEEDIRAAIYADFNGNSDNPVVGLGETIFASRFSVPVIKDADFDGLISISISKKYESGGTGYTTSIDLDATEYPTIEPDDIYIQIKKQE